MITFFLIVFVLVVFWLVLDSVCKTAGCSEEAIRKIVSKQIKEAFDAGYALGREHHQSEMVEISENEKVAKTAQKGHFDPEKVEK